MSTLLLSTGEEVLVDDDDLQLVSNRAWQKRCGPKDTTVYAKCSIGPRNSRRTILMHRLILGVLDNKTVLVDHINGNGLDNRRCNLRLCNHVQSAQNRKIRADNTTGYRGVFFRKDRNKYAAYIKVNKKSKYLGLFQTAEEASAVYEAAAKKHFCEFYTERSG